MIVKANSHIINFANIHFENLKNSIVLELCDKSAVENISTATEDNLKELKKKLGVSLYKLYMNELPFKLTYSQCKTLREKLNNVYIHKETYENEYNNLLKMLKDILDVAINNEEELEFNK